MFVFKNIDELRKFIESNYGTLCDQILYLSYNARDRLITSEDDAVLKAMGIVMYLKTGSPFFTCEGMTKEETDDLVISEIDYFIVDDDDEFASAEYDQSDSPVLLQGAL